MNGLDPAMMQRVQQLIQQNPQLAMLLQKPGLMQKLQAIAQNPNDPMIAQQYASDPDVQQLIQILGPAMGMNQGGMGMGNMSGFGGFGQQQNQNQNQQHQHLIYINSENQFLDILTKAAKDKLIVCDFFATWCGPCKVIAPEFERFAKLYKDRAIFIKVDVDKNRNLAQNRKIAAMPTFHFYKNKIKIDEMRGANVGKLESLITKHISDNIVGVNNNNDIGINLKPSPYKNFPLHEKNRPIYTRAPFKKMKDKLCQLNNKFIEDEREQQQQENNNNDNNNNKTNHSLNDFEWKLLTQIMNMLQDRQSYLEQKFNNNHYELLEKLLLWPSETLPPVLDLIRVLSLHPSFAEHCSKNFNLILKIIKIGGNGLINAVNGMLTCRIIINLFNRRVIAKVLEENYTTIINNLLFNMMCDERKNTRLAFVRVILHFTYCFYVISYSKSNKSDIYRGEKLRCFSLLTEILYREKDIDIMLNILMGIGTLLFRDENLIQFANSLDIIMIFKSYKQKYEKNEEIVNCCNELIQCIEKPNL